MDASFIAKGATLALFTETIITTFTWALEGAFNWKRVAALILGPLLTVATGVDIFQMVGLPLAVPYAGAALTGLLICRGATVSNDLFSLLKGLGLKVGNVPTLPDPDPAPLPADIPTPTLPQTKS